MTYDANTPDFDSQAAKDASQYRYSSERKIVKECSGITRLIHSILGTPFGVIMIFADDFSNPTLVEVRFPINSNPDSLYIGIRRKYPFLYYTNTELLNNTVPEHITLRLLPSQTNLAVQEEPDDSIEDVTATLLDIPNLLQKIRFYAQPQDWTKGY